MGSLTSRPRVFAGLVLVALGIGFLLQNVTDFDINWGDVWPVILIVLGVISLPSSRWVGVLLVLVGAAFLADNLDIINIDVEDYLWPLILVAVGVLILFGGRSRRRSHKSAPSESPSTDTLDASALFGSTDQQITSQQFKGGKVSAVFGSVELDLRGAALAGGEATLNIETVLGSAELLVPNDWTVNVQASETLGSVKIKRSQPSSPAATLTVTGSCTLGSITVR
jgi:predicted membrane protein